MSWGLPKIVSSGGYIPSGGGTPRGDSYLWTELDLRVYGVLRRTETGWSPDRRKKAERIEVLTIYKRPEIGKYPHGPAPVIEFTLRLHLRLVRCRVYRDINGYK